MVVQVVFGAATYAARVGEMLASLAADGFSVVRTASGRNKPLEGLDRRAGGVPNVSVWQLSWYWLASPAPVEWHRQPVLGHLLG